MTNKEALSRREFLKTAGAGAAAVTATCVLAGTTGPAQASGPASDNGWGMLIDVTRCTGCESCALACKEANGRANPTVVPTALLGHAFDTLGMRRVEWKCDALNAPSRRAAIRLGFAYEGTFRQHMVIKGRNRDTAWFSMLDHEWPRARAALDAWLDPGNFDARGSQRRGLAELRALL